jgi:hypothetical protein
MGLGVVRAAQGAESYPTMDTNFGWGVQGMSRVISILLFTCMQAMPESRYMILGTDLSGILAAKGEIPILPLSCIQTKPFRQSHVQIRGNYVGIISIIYIYSRTP